ncbi:MAG: glycosyltransferase family 4 protein, partial [Patescibacteria group bacterium]
MSFNIVFASGTYPNEIGGMATFVRNLAHGFFAAGNKVSVLAYANQDGVKNEGFPIRLISRRGGALARYLRYFLALWRLSDGADAIYAQDLVSSGFPAAAVSLLTGRPLVVRLGGDFLWEKAVNRGLTKVPLSRYYDSPKNWREKIYLMIYRFVLGRCRLVIFNSKFQFDLYQKHFSLDKTAPVVIENPLPQVASRPAQNRGDWLYIGRFVELKNIKRLISVFARAGVNKKLRLVGEGPQRPELEKMVLDLGLKEKVSIEKAVSPAEVSDLLRSCGLLILPSLTELSPNIVLEALSYKTPVLLTAENGLP